MIRIDDIERAKGLLEADKVQEAIALLDMLIEDEEDMLKD